MAWWNNSGNLSYKDDYGSIYTVNWVRKTVTNPGQLLFDITTTIVGPVWGRTPQVKVQTNKHNLVECEETTIEQIFQIFGTSLPNDYSVTTVSAKTDIVYRYIGADCAKIYKNPFTYGLNNAVIDTDQLAIDGPGCWSDPDDPNTVQWNGVGTGNNFWIDVWGA